MVSKEEVKKIYYLANLNVKEEELEEAYTQVDRGYCKKVRRCSSFCQ